jgi:hypothetical protein
VNPAFRSFLAIDVQEREEVFIATAQRLGVQPFLVEKDFWVCVVLDILFHSMAALPITQTCCLKVALLCLRALA